MNVTGRDDDEGERGVDAVFDGIGGKSLKASYEILHSGGRLVAYGGTPTTDLENWLMMFTLNLVRNSKPIWGWSDGVEWSTQAAKCIRPSNTKV